jgi:hypothetical protein
MEEIMNYKVFLSAVLTMNVNVFAAAVAPQVPVATQVQNPPVLAQNVQPENKGSSWNIFSFGKEEKKPEPVVAQHLPEEKHDMMGFMHPPAPTQAARNASAQAIFDKGSIFRTCRGAMEQLLEIEYPNLVLTDFFEVNLYIISQLSWIKAALEAGEGTITTVDSKGMQQSVTAQGHIEAHMPADCRFIINKSIFTKQIKDNYRVDHAVIKLAQQLTKERIEETQKHNKDFSKQHISSKARVSDVLNFHAKSLQSGEKGLFSAYVMSANSILDSALQLRSGKKILADAVFTAPLAQAPLIYNAPVPVPQTAVVVGAKNPNVVTPPTIQGATQPNKQASKNVANNFN